MRTAAYNVDAASGRCRRKNVPRRILFYRNRSIGKIKKKPSIKASSKMQEMGLEPTRHCCHRHLKPARLPIPPLLRTNDIVSDNGRKVKYLFVRIFQNVYIYMFFEKITKRA